MPDAYKLREEYDRAALEHVEAEAARREKLDRELARAQEKRQKAYSDADTAACRAGNHPTMAMNAAVRRSRRPNGTLDPAVRNQLGRVAVPDLRLAGAGRFVSAQRRGIDMTESVGIAAGLRGPGSYPQWWGQPEGRATSAERLRWVLRRRHGPGARRRQTPTRRGCPLGKRPRTMSGREALAKLRAIT